MQSVVLAAAIALSGPTAGCSQAAKVELKNGGAVRGKIMHNSQGRLSVHTDRGIYELPVEQVEDIDHPGDGTMIGGGVLVIGGAGVLISTAGACDDEETAAGGVGCTASVGTLRFAAVAMLLTGLGIGIYGLVTKMGSVRRSRPGFSPMAQPEAAPAKRPGPRR